MLKKEFEWLDYEGLNFELFLDLKRYVVPNINKIEEYKNIFYNEYKEYCEFNNYKYEKKEDIKGGFLIG